jgi:hypothetical protein
MCSCRQDGVFGERNAQIDSHSVTNSISASRQEMLLPPT